MHISRIKGWFLVSAGMLFLLAGCGNDTTKTEYLQTTAPASTYLVEYIPGTMMSGAMADATVGKTTFRLRVRERSTFAAATGLQIELIPTMYMSGHSHGTPADTVVESTTPGTYDCTVYYLMMSGTGMMGGYWELKVKIGSETTMFYPSVGMAMGTDTVRATLKGQSNDLISTMTGTDYRSYYLFRDGTATTDTIKLYLASNGNMLATYPAIYSGATLTNHLNQSWAVTSVLVEATTDTLSTWQTGTNSGGSGHWIVSGLTLTSAQTNTVYVRLTVNGSVKTTNGQPVNSSVNDVAVMTVTP